MIKKNISLCIFLIVFSVFVLMPLDGDETFAETVNAVYLTDFDVTPTSSLINPEFIFDNDTTTRGTILYSKTVTVNFKNPVFLEAFESAGQDFNIRFYGEVENLGGFAVYSSGLSTKLLNYNKPVTRVTITNPSGNNAILSHLVFKKKVIPHDEVKNLLSTVTDKSVSITWDEPTLENFIQTDIYKDGSKVASVPKGTGVWKDNDVVPSTSYNYKLKAVYDDSYETNGVNITAVTSSLPPDPSEIPPAIVLSFVADEIKETAALLKWTYPENENISKVVIYDSKNEKVVELDSSETSYELKDLKIGTAYSYSIKTKSKDGLYSVATSVSFSTLPDTTPPATPTIVRVSSGDSVIDAVWTFNKEPDFAGYNIYLDGVKVNDTPYKHDNYRFSSLENGRVYKIEVEAVDVSGNKSTKMTASGSPVAPKVPSVSLAGINLKDVADGIANWFGGLWLIIVFAVAIPLALLIANRVKQLFLR